MSTPEALPTESPELQADQPSGVKPTGKSVQTRTGGQKFARVAVLVICVLWMVPAFGLLVSSFRSSDAVSTTGWWTALYRFWDLDQWTLDNYVEVLEGGMGTAFVNSLVVAIPSTIIPILLAAFAAYAFSWMDFPGRETLFILVVALLVVPLHVAFIPLLRIYGGLGVTGTFASLWLAHTGFGMPLAVYLLRNYMSSLPREVIESAKVDGASHYQTFWRLMIPLSVPALAAFAIFQFLWTWNDLLVALVFLGTTQDVQVVTVALQGLIGSRGQDWHLLTAAAFITMTVPLIVFFSLQRYFVRGLTAGSVKG
ncbi:MAG TPA: carbohydrate ABC transporter permease [Euzebyales bacterium]|nr:carbohydrate ABC transporter permease [Euzebyales bacterium]